MDSLTTVQTFAHRLSTLKTTPTARPQCYIVGGYVRDTLLGLTPTDIDVEVYGVSAPVLDAMVRKEFQDARITIIPEFGVWKVRKTHQEISFSLPRTEQVTGEKHTDFAVSINPKFSKRVAVQRRDFTCNALLQSPTTGRIYDYVGGVEDITQKLLRAVDLRSFETDALRAWRAIQLVGRLGFTIEKHTATAIKRMSTSPAMQQLSGARIREELDKLFRYGAPSAGLGYAQDLGLSSSCVPELGKILEKQNVSVIDNLQHQSPAVQLALRWNYLLKKLAPTKRLAFMQRLQISKKYLSN